MSISIPFWGWFGWCWGVLKGYSVTVKGATLIFISGRCSAQEGKSGSIYLVELISCLSWARVVAIHGNPDHCIYLPFSASPTFPIGHGEVSRKRAL